MTNPDGTNWKIALHKSLLAFVQTRDPRATRLISWEEEAGMGGYCPTCEYSTIVMTFEYETADGGKRTLEHEGGLGDLMRELT